MGDRIYGYYDCPKCGKRNGVEVYDHFSALLYVEKCQYCDYEVDLNYYEEDENTVVLCSKEEARKRGFLCKKCDDYLYFEERKTGICEKCKK